MTHVERAPNLSGMLAPTPGPIEFIVNRDPFVISASNSSALSEGEGQHLIIVRKDNAPPEFEPGQRNKLAEAAVASLFTPDCQVLCLGENHGSARNSKNQHPHLHVLRSLAPESNLPPQWRGPHPSEHGANSFQKTSLVASSMRDMLRMIQEQYSKAHEFLAQSANAGKENTGSRIIQQMERLPGDLIAVRTFVYGNLVDDKSLRRLVEKKTS